MEMNFYAILGSAAVSLITGFIWYSPKVFGTVWMRESGVNPENKGNMALIFGLTFVFSLMISLVMMSLSIHQTGALGMVGGDATNANPSYAAFMSDYGTAFRTFKHGALHGTIAGIFFAFPIVAITGMFERKSWKYIFIVSGYWVLTLMLMGGILCAWL